MLNLPWDRGSSTGSPAKKGPDHAQKKRVPKRVTSENQDPSGDCHSRGLVEAAVQDVGDLLDFGHEFGVLVGDDGLDAVGEGFLGLVMDFD
jgi:hypothetical protein